MKMENGRINGSNILKMKFEDFKAVGMEIGPAR